MGGARRRSRFCPRRALRAAAQHGNKIAHVSPDFRFKREERPEHRVNEPHKHRDRSYRGGRSRHWIKVMNRKHPATEREF
jgi:hypothetical protein